MEATPWCNTNNLKCVWLFTLASDFTHDPIWEQDNVLETVFKYRAMPTVALYFNIYDLLLD